MTDLLFTQPKTQQVKLSLLGKTNTGIRLYQKILILMLSDSSGLYRSNMGTVLTSVIGRSNLTQPNMLLQLGRTACTDALRFLDSQDRQLISSLQASYQNGELFITMKLTDGTTYTGGLNI